MSLTAWKTYASGDNATAADRNTYERDNGRWLSGASTGGRPLCRVDHTTNQSIADSTVTTLNFNNDDFDPQDIHDTATNNERITIPTGGGGKYLIGAAVEWAANSTGRRRVSVFEDGSTEQAQTQVQTTSAGTMAIQAWSIFNLNAAQYVVVKVFQTSGGNLNVLSTTNYSPKFWAIWIGE